MPRQWGTMGVGDDEGARSLPRLAVKIAVREVREVRDGGQSSDGDQESDRDLEVGHSSDDVDEGVAVLSAVLAAREGDVLVEPQHRKKWTYKQLHPFRPIPKTDIRRNFAVMWANVWNWADSERYRGFLETFTSKLCVNENVIDPQVKQILEETVPYTVAESSFETSLQNYAHIMSIADDATCKLLSYSVVRSKRSRTTKIFMKIRLSGTKTYDVVAPQRVGDQLKISKVDGTAPLPSTDLQELRNHRVLRASPEFVDTENIMVVEVDEFTQGVTSLICRCHFVSITPVSSS